MECYSTIKKKEVMPFAGRGMALEIITLSKISKTQRNKYHILLHICGVLTNTKWAMTQKLEEAYQRRGSVKGGR